MDKELFNELLSGVKEMNEIQAGKRKPVKKTRIERNDIMEIRQTLKLTQTQFATAFGVSVATLRNWEQGHRHPTGPAVTLIKVARRHPKAILETLHAS